MPVSLPSPILRFAACAMFGGVVASTTACDDEKTEDPADTGGVSTETSGGDTGVVTTETSGGDTHVAAETTVHDTNVFTSETTFGDTHVATETTTGDTTVATETTVTDTTPSETSDTPFVPEPVGALAPVGTTEQPVYVFLFTHTEDPFNHALSEARYQKTGDILDAVAAAHPDSHPEWTIQFQGSDAKTIGDRHGTGGVVAYLRGLAERGMVHFGYHGQHDPTYLNRPQKALTAASTFADVANAFDDWVSCERNLGTGACVTPGVGGVVEIGATFGTVEICSGLSSGDDGTGPFEDGGGNWALRRRVPDVRLAFGFSDHAPEVPNYEGLMAELFAILAPSGETSGGVWWAEDVLRVNDGEWLGNVHMAPLDSGAGAVAARLVGLDTHRVQVLNNGIASKWIYAKQSPTQYGYAHASAPELPAAQLLTAAEIEAKYQATAAGLEYLAGTYFADHAGSRFIGTDELRAIAAAPDMFEVTGAELDLIARWALTHWGARPPSFLSDGVEFYSLRDALGLLARALAADTLPATQTMGRFYGPEDAVAATGQVTLTLAEVRTLATAIAAKAAATVPTDPSAWTPTPPNLVPSQFTVGGKTLNAAQALYALALGYASTYAGKPVASLVIPATQPLPETFDIFDELGCVSCEDTSWSTKPARLRRL